MWEHSEDPVVVGKQPYIGSRVNSNAENFADFEQEFIMKAHIFAGAVRINRKYVSDYVWATKSEIPNLVSDELLKILKPLLAVR
jgi:hypothetical protein